MEVKAILAAELPRVVVAIGSYVAGIYAPLIPYSAKVEPAAKPEFIAKIVNVVIAEVLTHKPDCSPTVLFVLAWLASLPPKNRTVLF